MENRNTNRGFVKNRKVNGVPASSVKYPKHFTDMVLLLKNNAELRRFTALGILLQMHKNGISGEHEYVVFKWDKLSVIINGLAREYKYSEGFFVKSFIASLQCLVNEASSVMGEFVVKEMPEAADTDSDLYKGIDVVSAEIEDYIRKNNASKEAQDEKE